MGAGETKIRASSRDLISFMGAYFIITVSFINPKSHNQTGLDYLKIVRLKVFRLKAEGKRLFITNIPFNRSLDPNIQCSFLKAFGLQPIFLTFQEIVAGGRKS